MRSAKTAVDRPALVRRALVELVAENGFRGTSMAAVAERAGVATGTAYVHYESKDDLVVAAYQEVKRGLSAAGASAITPTAPPAERFRQLWYAIYEHLASDPARARFLVQFEASPYAAEAHADYLAAEDDPLLEAALKEDMAALLVDLPLEMVFELGFGPALRLATADASIEDAVLDQIVRSCWRAITRE
ncbi:MAG: TetR/AcrR family transcriptional regulator [Actinomycetota bacterium]|nr:TetR/AcrR family transcriptional regulator [Actinomycetota bacterium]